MSKEKVILAYSGGLDTSVAITWLKKDYDVIAVCMDVGEGKDLEFIHDKALKVGAVESYVIDVKEEFANDYVLVEETFIDKLEDKLRQIRSITELLSGGFTPERIVELLYEDISVAEEEAEMSGAHVKKYVEDYEILEESEIEYKCNCTREKYYKRIS